MTNYRGGGRSGRVSPGLVAALAARLTGRDRFLLGMLHEHRVLATGQIDELAFGNRDAARHRLLVLYRHAAVDRFRPWVPRGSAPWHYVLGPAGAHVLAAEQARTVAELGYRPDKTLAIAHSPRLGHTVGVNAFFTALAAAARHGPDRQLAAWWSEARCAEVWGDLAHPDAYGRWREGAAEVDFFLEYDTGAEPLDRVSGKLAGYADLATATGITTPVLFWLPSGRREANLRRHLTRQPDTAPSVPVATTHAAATAHAAAAARDGPAAAIWLPRDETGPRRRLAQLATLTGTEGGPV